MTLIGRVRRVAPAELRVLGHRMRRASRVERRSVQRSLVVPASLPSAARRPSSVWGIALMRNEQDTVRHVVEHMFSQDVDVVLIADNGSTDATPDILQSLRATNHVHVVQDRLSAFAQGTKMTALAELARAGGADWIIPFDADELWFAADRSVGSFLRSCDAAVVHAELHNVFPSNDDDPEQADPFLRLHRVDTERSPFGKVAFRAHRFVRVEMGNVDVVRRGRRSDGLMVAHYPWRTFGQLAAKLRHGRKATMEADLPEEANFHWRIAGAWSDDVLRVAWDDLLAGRPVEELAWSPSGRLRVADPGTALTWADVLPGGTAALAADGG